MQSSQTTSPHSRPRLPCAALKWPPLPPTTPCLGPKYHPLQSPIWKWQPLPVPDVYLPTTLRLRTVRLLPGFPEVQALWERRKSNGWCREGIWPPHLWSRLPLSPKSSEPHSPWLSAFCLSSPAFSAQWESGGFSTVFVKPHAQFPMQWSHVLQLIRGISNW